MTLQIAIFSSEINVHRRFCKPLVGSSILSPGTIKIKAFAWRGFVQKTGQIQRASESNEQGADANGERLT